VDPNTRAIVRRLMVLFGLDSVGGGFLSSALIAYWFFQRYGTSEVHLASLFFAARVLNVLSHFAAGWIARRIGLLNTMVFTHLPSSIFLMLAPLAPTASIAAALFSREALVEMDVPTRQSYVMAVVPRSSRTYASGMTNVTRNAGWAAGPLVGGMAMLHLALAAPLLIGRHTEDRL
jgi:predicted MFS family arabinose efflux permease